MNALARRSVPAPVSRKRFLGAAAVGLGALGTAGVRSAAAAAAPGAALGLNAVYRSTQQLVTRPIPLDRGLVTDSHTPQVVTHAVGPIDLRAGDVVLLTAREEFTNPNAHAGCAWRIDGTVSEHWSLWVMASLGIQRGTSVSAAQGVWVRSQTAENWDGYIHHKTVDVTEWDVVPCDLPGAYYYTVCYFASAPVYRLPGAQVVVEGESGQLTAAVLRAFA